MLNVLRGIPDGTDKVGIFLGLSHQKKVTKLITMSVYNDAGG